MGDELLLTMLKNWCHEMGAVLSAMSINPAYTRSSQGIEAVDAFDLMAVAEAMQQSDLFVLGGGGLFQTHQPFTIPALYSFHYSDISGYARPVLMAQQMGLPVLLWAQGVGPLQEHESRQIAKSIFENADFVSVRDQGSKDLLVEVGVTRDIPVFPDPSWAYQVRSPRETYHELRDRKRIGLVIRPWNFVKGWQEKLVNALKNTVSPRDYQLVWIPFQCIDGDSTSHSDSQYLKKLIELAGDGFQHELIDGSGVEKAVSVLGQCDFVITMRLHAQILAFKLNKPLLCLEYDKKMAAASMQSGLLPASRLNLDDSAERWEAAVKNLLSTTSNSQSVIDKVAELGRQADGHREILSSALACVEAQGKNKSCWNSNKFNWLSAWADDFSYRTEVAHHEEVSRLRNIVEQCQRELSEQHHAVKILNGLIDQQRAKLAAYADSQKEKIAELARLNQSLASDKNTIQNLKKDLLDREAQISEINREFHAAKDEIRKIKSSTSWGITRPMRFTKLFLQQPQKSSYNLAKYIYWRLPPGVRQTLHGPRHSFVRWARGMKKLPTLSVQNESCDFSDLSWQKFNTQVLAFRDKYKGIFIQELVIDWNVPLYQRPQHISAAFGRLGYLVIYRTDNWAGDNVNGFREVSPNVWITNRHEVAKIDDAVRSVYSTAYANTPELLMENGKRGVLVYEYIDHIDPQISGDEENIRRLLSLKEFAFKGGADYIVASAKRLEAEAIQEVGSDRVILAQNGVDTRHYRNSVHKSTPIPENLVQFRKKYSKIVGYFGALAPWLWYDVISEMVHQRSDIGFVFIGPDYYGGAEKLPDAENLLYLGTVDYKVLPAYAMKFDVCFIPFAPSEIARTTSPLKLFEYFALEKPVVVTSEMLECVAFEEVLSGDSTESLIAAIDSAMLLKDDHLFRDRLARLADQNDWDQRAKAMESVFQKIKERV